MKDPHFVKNKHQRRIFIWGVVILFCIGIAYAFYVVQTRKLFLGISPFHLFTLYSAWCVVASLWLDRYFSTLTLVGILGIITTVLSIRFLLPSLGISF